MRKAVSLIVGCMLLVIGNYMPKVNYVKNVDVKTEKARKINRFLGYETVIMGLLFFVSIFLPPVSSVICLCLLIPYVIIGIIYGVIKGKSTK